MPIHEIVMNIAPGIGILILIMSADIISGIVRAAILGKVSSRKMTHGVTIKAGILFVVFVAFAIDFVVMRYMPWAKEIAPVSIGKIVALWYMVVDAISFLENLNRMGVPLPKFFVQFLVVAKSQAESSIKVPKMEIEHLHVREAGLTKDAEQIT